MLALGLKLLGIGKFLRDFFLNNWKWLIPLLILVVGFLWTKDHYYDLGQSEERLAWEEKIEKEREDNKKLTELLASSVTNFGTVALQENQDRISREVIRENRISTIVEERPVYTECLVDQEVLDEQNAIKALGPKP